MTTDMIALTERMPDSWSVLAALMSAGPDTVLTTRAEGAVLQLSDAAGRPLASVETPALVRVPGESARLLGLTAAEPSWWTEIRAASATPQAARLAGLVATRLVAQLGGRVWPDGAAAPGIGAEVVPGLTGARAPAAEQPAVDVLTDRAAIVLQDRPLVAMTAWLSDALRAASADRRALQLVTPPGTRLTLATRLALTGVPNRWVVRDGSGGYYDGLSGEELRWEDGAFTPTGGYATPFADPPPAAGPDGRQLLLTFRTRRPATAELRLGGPLETVWRALTGGPPAGWGTAEPAGRAWSPAELTEFVRGRVPAPTSLVVVGDAAHPVLATLRVVRTASGVEEEVTAAFGPGGAGEGAEEDGAGAGVSHRTLLELADRLSTDHDLVSLLVQHRMGRADLTVPPWIEGPPAPVAFALGGADVHGIGRSVAARPPLTDRPHALGPTHAPGYYYPISGSSAGAAWQSLQGLLTHLGAPTAAPPTGPPTGVDQPVDGPGTSASP